ncbi:MAG: MerR family transcriptional regulator, partial [Myxococcota bacterium]
MQIGRAAALAGVSIKALRHWEAEGLLPEVPRTGRYRRYGAEHVERVRLVAHCRDRGFSIAEIREILALLPAVGCPDPEPMRALVRARLLRVRDEIAALRAVEARLSETAAYLDGR